MTYKYCLCIKFNLKNRTTQSSIRIHSLVCQNISFLKNKGEFTVRLEVVIGFEWCVQFRKLSCSWLIWVISRIPSPGSYGIHSIRTSIGTTPVKPTFLFSSTSFPTHKTLNPSIFSLTHNYVGLNRHKVSIWLRSFSFDMIRFFGCLR